LNYAHAVGETENISFISVVEDTEHFSILGRCQECCVCRSSHVRRLWCHAEETCIDLSLVWMGRS